MRPCGERNHQGQQDVFGVLDDLAHRRGEDPRRHRGRGHQAERRDAERRARRDRASWSCRRPRPAARTWRRRRSARSTAMPTRMIAWRRSRNALARKIRIAATAPTTTSCAHCPLAAGCHRDQAEGTARAATPSSTPVSTVLDRRAAAATCSPVRVTSDGRTVLDRRHGVLGLAGGAGEDVAAGDRAEGLPGHLRHPQRDRRRGARRPPAPRPARRRAIRGPGTSQYIRTSATTAAPKPAVHDRRGGRPIAGR